MGAIWQGFIQLLTQSLVYLQDVVGSYGLAIIVFTIIVRLATYPLNQKQMESSKAMQELQPKLQELQKKYGKDREKLSQETMALYREHGVNPMAGCLPMIIQMPIWIGLYRALLQMASDGLLHGGFLWVPSLAQPTGLSWITSPANWVFPDTALYLILPIITLVTQVIVQRMITPTAGGGDDSQQAMMNQMMNFMPLMFGFFALQVPSGLTLYWATSNILQIVQQGFSTGWEGILPGRLALPKALLNPGKVISRADPPSEEEPKGTEDAPLRKRRKKKRRR